MPCYDARDHEDKQPVIDNLTRLLCEACRTLEELSAPVSGGLASWWHYHKKEDALRKRREAQQERKRQLREEVKKKLTSEEWDAIR